MSLITQQIDNPYYNDIIEMFGNETVQRFFRKYMTNDLDEKLMLKLGKLYIFIQDSLENPSPKDIITIIDKLIKNPKTRKSIIHNKLPNNNRALLTNDLQLTQSS